MVKWIGVEGTGATKLSTSREVGLVAYGTCLRKQIQRETDELLECLCSCKTVVVVLGGV